MDSDKEISALKKDKLKARNKGHLKELAEVCNYLGSKLSERGRLDEALEEHKEELDISETLKDTLGVTIAYRCIGEVYSEMEDYGEALRNLKVYLEMADKSKNYVELQRAWTTLGRTYFMKGDLKNAEEAHGMAIKFTEKVRSSVPEREYADMKCRTFLNLALIFDQRDKVNEGSQYYMKAIQLATKHGLKETLHRCQSSLAQFYQKLAYYPRASKLFDEAIATAKSLKSKVFICEYLLSKGYLLLLVKDYQGARHYFKKAYFTKSPVDSDSEKAKKYLRLTTNVCKALKALSRASTMNEKLKIYDKLGDLFAELEVYKIAVEYYLKELECANDLDKSGSELAAIYVSIAQTYLDDKQYEKAIEYFEEEKKQRRGNVFEEVRTSLKIIETKIAQELSYEEMLQLYESALELASENIKAKRKVLQDFKCYCLQELDERKASELDKLLKGLDNTESNEAEDLKEENENDTASGGEEEAANESYNLSDISDPSSESDAGDNEERDVSAVASSEPRLPRKAASRMGSKLAKRNEMGETPLHRACIAGNYKEVNKLLEKGHPVDVRDHCGWLPIHEAANHGFHELVELLIDNGADLNDRGGEKCDGTTPLHDACSNAIPGVIKLLVRKGANVAALDNAGNTPCDCLRIWRQRVDELDVDEELVYKSLLKELEDAMRKIGLDPSRERTRPLIALNSPEKEQESRPKRSRNHILLGPDDSPAKSPPRKKQPSCHRAAPVGKVSTTTIVQLENEIDFDDPDVAKEEYMTAISNLRRQKDSISGQGAKRAKTSSKCALLNEDEFVRDWLEDDIGGKGNKEQPCRDLYHSKNLPTKYRSPPRPGPGPKNKSKEGERRRKRDEEEKGAKSRSVRNDAERRRRRSSASSGSCCEEGDEEKEERVGERRGAQEEEDDICQVVDEVNSVYGTTLDDDDDGFTFEGEEHPKAKAGQAPSQSGSGGASRVDHQSGRGGGGRTGPSQSQAVIEKNESAVLIKVHIDGNALLIKLPDKVRKVSWLAEETISRYYRMKKTRPVIELTTKDGALLSPEDLITDVVTDGEVTARVESFQVAPLSSRYREECQVADLLPLADLSLELQSAEEGGILSLSNASICGKHFKALLDAINGSDLIRTVDLSFTWLPQTRHLCEVLATLPRLEELQLKATGLNRTGINLLARHKLPISHLDLSYNALDSGALGPLGELISNFSSLTTLTLICCELSSADFKRANALVKAVTGSTQLRSLVVDDTIAADEEVAKLYSSERLEGTKLTLGITRLSLEETCAPNFNCF